ncbi:MAG: DUF192 domain-containing protein, partial [Marinobacter sp.]
MKPALKSWLLAAGLAAAVTGCGPTDAGEQPALPRIEACFVSADNNHAVVLEVASEGRERQRGLMGRTALEDEAGMLFTYRSERPASHGFWMFQTLIPLDIAYLDDNGVIVSIQTMTPCPSSRGRDCPSYPSGQPFWNAVEMNAGYFEAQG